MQQAWLGPAERPAERLEVVELAPEVEARAPPEFVPVAQAPVEVVAAVRARLAVEQLQPARASVQRA